MEWRPNVAISHRKQKMTRTPILNSSRFARHAVLQGVRHVFLPQGTIEKLTIEIKNKNKNKNNYYYKNSLDLPKLLNVNTISLYTQTLPKL